VHCFTEIATVSCVSWSKYTTGSPRNIIFDANVTNLAYIESDLYREEGTAFIGKSLDTVLGR
jgi:hypothetical protein